MKKVHTFALAFTLACALIVVFIMLRSCGGPSIPNELQARGNDNWQYWQQLNEISKRGTALGKSSNEAQPPEAIISQMQKLTTDLRTLSRSVSALPVVNIDSEVINYSAELVYLLNESSDTASDTARLIGESKKDQDDANSFGSGVEAFVRGLFGDPLGAYNDQKAQGAQLSKKGNALKSRLTELQQKSNKLEALQIQVRSALSQRYHRDFPKLE